MLNDKSEAVDPKSKKEQNTRNVGLCIAAKVSLLKLLIE